MRTVPRYALVAGPDRAGRVDRLATRLPRVGWDGVLADLDRTGEHRPVPGEAAGEGFTWDAYDRDDPEWWPQGMASPRSGSVLLVSWYARRRRARTGGTRISVVDRSSPGAPRYRHVRLVVPRRRPGRSALGAVPVHAGGISVVGDVLHVADTLWGVRVFRLGDVLRRPLADGAYEYVLPEWTAFRVPLRAGTRRVRYSFLSAGTVDGRPNLVVGEYRRAGGAPRLVRYPLEPATGLPAVDDHGVCAPLEVYENQPDRMQGAAVHGTTWVLTASAGEGRAGDLYVGRPGNWRRHRAVLPPGPEDLDWSRPGEELWSLSEWPGRRWVFPVRARLP
jgi:hypothetical protein